MGLCSAFITDAFGEFLWCLGATREEGEKQEPPELKDFPWLLWRGHLRFEICSTNELLLTGLAITPILRIDGGVKGWVRDLFTLPDERVDSLQWEESDPAPSQKCWHCPCVFTSPAAGKTQQMAEMASAEGQWRDQKWWELLVSNEVRRSTLQGRPVNGEMENSLFLCLK